MTLLLTLLSLCSTAWSSEPVGYRGDGSGSFAVDPAPRLTLDAPRTCWNTPLPSWSNASPVVVGDRICTTSEPTDLLCLNREDGTLLWRAHNDYVDTLDPVSGEAVLKQLEVARATRTELLETQVAYSALRREIRRDPSRASELSGLADRLSSLEAVLAGVAPFVTPPEREIIGYASATPISDGTHLFGVFGHGVVSSFSLTGDRVWSVWLGPPPREMNGYHVGTAASPRLVDGVLIVAHGELVGMDPATGEVRWRLAEPYIDYGTPTVVELGGVGFVALPSGEIVRARDGVVVARGLGSLWFVGPMWDGERLYYLGGEGKAQIAATGSVRSRAYRLRLEGDVITPELQWQAEIETRAAFYSAPVRVGELIYLIDNDAQLSVLEASSGRVVAHKSLQQPTALGQVYAPLVTSADSVYIAGEAGGFAHLAGGRTPELVGHWEVGGSRAGPWVDGKRLYVRGLEAMICLEGK